MHMQNCTMPRPIHTYILQHHDLPWGKRPSTPNPPPPQPHHITAPTASGVEGWLSRRKKREKKLRMRSRPAAHVRTAIELPLTEPRHPTRSENVTTSGTAAAAPRTNVTALPSSDLLELSWREGTLHMA